MESVRPVHKPWMEISPRADIIWEPRCLDQYTGPLGGSEPGPTTWIKDVVHRADSLACIFLAIIPWSFFEMIAKWTSKYAYKDWVVEVTGKDRDGNLKKKVHLEMCTENTEGCRHQADNEVTKYKITPGFVLCWFALIILQGAHFGSNNKDTRRIWKKHPRGFNLPYVRNAMPVHAYEFMRR